MTGRQASSGAHRQPTSRAPIEISELARMLDALAPSLAPELLPNGRREGKHWATSNISDVRTGNYSLKVNLDGPRVGMWTDFGAPQGARDRSGDMLKLVALVKYGGDLGEACKFARSYLGIDGMDPNRLATRRAEVEKRQRDADEETRRKAEKMIRLARGLWREAEQYPFAGSIAERYLRARGIPLDRLPRLPRSLRFHPSVYCRELADAGAAHPYLPAMIACVLDPAADCPAERRHMATHRTYLKPDGSGKAELDEAKKCLGSFWGGYIPIWKGAVSGTLHEVPDGTGVDVGEGIEDCLTVACALPERRVIAAVTLGNIGQIALPWQIGDLTIIGQNDTQPKAIAALDVAIGQQVERAPDRTILLAKPGVAA